jgi:uncharacterized repeat protein (TIGR01451 family)
VTSRRRRYAVVAVAVLAASVPPGSASASSSAPPVAFTLRYSGAGWADLSGTAATALACADPAAECTPVDVDNDPSTTNSSRAPITIPPGASVDWAGLYWAGDRGPRCEATPGSTPPPAAGHPNQAKIALGDTGYVSVTANSVTDVAGPAGGAGYQAYADVTGLLRPLSQAAAPVTLPVTVADLHLSRGVGCTGAWSLVLAYSYQDGPQATYAPTYQSIAVFDGVVAATAGGAAQIRLSGLVTPPSGTVQTHLASALLASDREAGLSVNGTSVTWPPTSIGPGYRTFAGPGTLAAGSTAATATVTSPHGTFAAAVLGFVTKLPVAVDLSVKASVVPSVVLVGDDATVTLTVHNDADIAAPGVAVTARLPAGLSLPAAVAGYDQQTGVWTVGTVPARGTASLTLPVRVLTGGPWTTTAEVTASQIADVDSTPGDGTTTEDDEATTTLTASEPSTAAPAAPPPSTETAEAAAPGFSWPKLLPAALVGAGLFGLGLFMLLVLAVRRHARL